MSLFAIPSGLSHVVSEALEDLNDHLSKQSPYVDNVSVLENVSVDMDRTLQYRQQCEAFADKHILRGIVVTVKSSYKLSPLDAMWMPKELGRGRSIFDAEGVDRSALEDIKLGDFNDSITVNKTLDIDEMGNVKENSMLIVDTGIDSMDSWEYLTSKNTLASMMESWQQNEGIMNMDRRVQIAKEVGTEKLIYEDTTCALYHDGTYIYVANHGVKNDEDMEKALYRHSSLGGYRFKDSTDKSVAFIQSDYGLGEKTYGYADLDDRTKKRLEQNYHWNGKSQFNTYVLRPPSIKSSDKPGEILRTEYGYFSPNDVSHMMDSEDILHIAPPNSSITVPIDMQHSLFQRLVFSHKELDKVGFHIFSKAHTGNSIEVPVNVIKQL